MGGDSTKAKAADADLDPHQVMIALRSMAVRGRDQKLTVTRSIALIERQMATIARQRRQLADLQGTARSRSLEDPQANRAACGEVPAVKAP